MLSKAIKSNINDDSDDDNNNNAKIMLEVLKFQISYIVYIFTFNILIL